MDQPVQIRSKLEDGRYSTSRLFATRPIPLIARESKNSRFVVRVPCDSKLGLRARFPRFIYIAMSRVLLTLGERFHVFPRATTYTEERFYTSSTWRVVPASMPIDRIEKRERKKVRVVFAATLGASLTGIVRSRYRGRETRERIRRSGARANSQIVNRIASLFAPAPALIVASLR